MIVQMIACGINPGDNAFIAGVFAKGSIPVSRYDICGVSGVGTVTQTGSGVPSAYLGRNVTLYRSLRFSDALVGTWCEEAHVHRQHCVLLPDDVPPEDYSGSLVNMITPFAFLQQVKEEGHKGIIATAGTSATGIAMLGICLAYDVPLISIVRDAASGKQLEALGAKNILIQTDPEFKKQLADMAQRLDATAVFDGVGSALLAGILDAFPRHTTIYSYGYLGGFAPLAMPLGLIMKMDLTLRSFGNFTSKTVSDPTRLDSALAALAGIIREPYFATRVGRTCGFEAIGDALSYRSDNGGKAVLQPSSR